MHACVYVYVYVCVSGGSALEWGCEDNLIMDQIEWVTEVNILHALCSSPDTVIALSTLGTLLTAMAF